MQVQGSSCTRAHRVQGSEFKVQGLGFGFKVQGSGCRVQGAGFRVQGSGFRVQGSGFGVHDLELPGPIGHGARRGRVGARSRGSNESISNKSTVSNAGSRR